MAMRRGNPLFWTHPQRPTLSPSLRREGSEMQDRRQGRRPRAYTLCWGLHLANDCMAVVCIRLWGRSLHPIAGAVPCAGPTIMFDRFSIPCLYPHVGRTPIMHYALCIGKVMFDRFRSPVCTLMLGERQFCIMHYALCIVMGCFSVCLRFAVHCFPLSFLLVLYLSFFFCWIVCGFVLSFSFFQSKSFLAGI